MKLSDNEVFGFIKPSLDVHTLGITTISNLLQDCGYKTIIAPNDVCEAVENIKKINNFSTLSKWLVDNNITMLGFSYRLDPQDAKNMFCSMFNLLIDYKIFKEQGGTVNHVFFAGLPDACRLIKNELGDRIIVFPGDETPIESLTMLGVPSHKLPNELKQNSDYDDMRWSFAKSIVESESYKLVQPRDHLGYIDAGTDKDSYLKRLEYCKNKKTLPIIRVHAGPYNSNRLEAIKEFKSWAKELSHKGLLDVLSIGSSQLTQSNFGENWDGMPNGGGVPVNSESEYREIYEAAKPMLVRTYAGTKNVPHLAIVHERSLNISWHALSFWWFCKIDGRGNNSVLDNLKEHIETIKYIASTGKPLEPNVPHHFAFRGADDISFIISGYLAAKTAKKFGIKHLIVQDMLNTPKYTWGIQDIAKARAYLKLLRKLEDDNFKISLQLRAGLDFFSPDLEKAKIQLAYVTALMDDIEPGNNNSPEIIHVVSYSEAVRLATPSIINESIQITLESLYEYRRLRREGKIEDMTYNKDVMERTVSLYEEANEGIDILERNIPNLYSAEGLFEVLDKGFFPLPYLIDNNNEYQNARKYKTALKNGGIRVVDEKGNIIRTSKRYNKILSEYEKYN